MVADAAKANCSNDAESPQVGSGVAEDAPASAPMAWSIYLPMRGQNRPLSILLSRFGLP
jgi:hypothetical protein